MAKTYDCRNFIQTAYSDFVNLFKNTKSWSKNDDKILKVLTYLQRAIRQQVHMVLAPQGTDKAEKEIREILAKYVVGYPEKKKCITFIGVISPISA